MFYNLFKILNTSTLNVGGFLEGFKKGPKGIIKNIFIILFAIYVIAVMIGMYTAYMIATYKLLAASGNQEAMPFITMLVALLVIMFFGFTSVAASYYTGSSEEFLMSLPLTPGQFFGAKFAVSFVSDAIMGLGMFTISSIVYGANEGLLTNPLFYIGFLVAALAFSLAAVFVIYLLFILVLYFIPALRKKKLMTVVATVLLIAFCIFYGLMNSSISMSFSNPKFMGEKMGSSIEKLFGLSDKLPVFMYISSALKGKILPILILAALSALILFVLVPLFGKMYIKTLDGFADVKAKKITAQKAEEVIEKDVRSVSIFHALFVRDYRNVVREPAFFANGPLFVYLFPVIFILSFSVGFIASGEGLGVIISAFQRKLAELSPESLKSAKYFVTLGSAAFVVFTGTFANLATTSFSREGKSLNDLKAMPIDFNLIVKVKFWHAMLYVGIANAIMIFLLTLAYFFLQVPLTFTDLFSICFMTVLVSGSVSLLLIFIDMFIDTLNPKLNWETPMAASKQNFNVLWSMLLSMLTVGLVVILVVFALPKSMLSLVILSIIYVIIAAPVGEAYFRYAEKRLKEM